MTGRRKDRPACRIERLDARRLARAAGQADALFQRAGWTAAAVAALLDAPGCFALLASVARRPAGLILARTVAEDCEVLWLAVVPSCRRRGIGRSLLRAALDDAARLGVRSAYLEVSEANHAARTLYEEAGFRHRGRRTGYYQSRPDGGPSDALVLSKELDRPPADPPSTSDSLMTKFGNRTS